MSSYFEHVYGEVSKQILPIEGGSRSFAGLPHPPSAPAQTGRLQAWETPAKVKPASREEEGATLEEVTNETF